MRKVVTHNDLPLLAVLYDNSSTVMMLKLENRKFSPVSSFSPEDYPSIDTPVDGDMFTTENGETHLYVAMEGSHQIVHFQHNPLTEGVFESRLHHGLATATPNSLESVSGSCLTEHSFPGCMSEDSNNSATCATGLTGGQVAGIAVGVTLGVVVVAGVALTPLILWCLANSYRNYSPETATGKSIEMGGM